MSLNFARDVVGGNALRAIMHNLRKTIAKRLDVDVTVAKSK